MIHNNNCDGANCASPTGQVRLLPAGDGNIILCRACFNHELRFRCERNREVSNQFDLPTWDSLKVHGAK